MRAKSRIASSLERINGKIKSVCWGERDGKREGGERERKVRKHNNTEFFLGLADYGWGQ